MTHPKREAFSAARQKASENWRQRWNGRQTQILIGMGTCGVAAGARQTWEAFADELQKHHLDDVRIEQTGCMGLCYSEPTVEVRVPDMPPIIYGKVNAEVARRIVRKHLLGRLLINDHIYDRPADDAFGRQDEKD